MLPRLSKYGIFDDIFNEPFYKNVENKLMKTDIREKDGNYILEIDIPGGTKEDVKLELENGYLTVIAEISKQTKNDDKTNYIHQERFYGKSSRTFYIGESITDSEIKASFKNGILTISFPNESEKEQTTKKYINIEE